MAAVTQDTKEVTISFNPHTTCSANRWSVAGITVLNISGSQTAELLYGYKVHGEIQGSFIYHFCNTG